MEQKKTTEISLEKLRARLPFGYAKLLQKTLKKKYKKEYSLQHIRRSLMNKHRVERIVIEAVLLADQQDGFRKEIKITQDEW